MPFIFNIVEKFQRLIVLDLKNTTEGRSTLQMHFKSFESKADIMAVQAELSPVDGHQTVRITHAKDIYMDLTCYDVQGLKMVQVTMTEALEGIVLKGKSDIEEWHRLYKSVADVCELERNTKRSFYASRKRL